MPPTRTRRLVGGVTRGAAEARHEQRAGRTLRPSRPDRLSGVRLASHRTRRAVRSQIDLHGAATKRRRVLVDQRSPERLTAPEARRAAPPAASQTRRSTNTVERGGSGNRWSQRAATTIAAPITQCANNERTNVLVRIGLFNWEGPSPAGRYVANSTPIFGAEVFHQCASTIVSSRGRPRVLESRASPRPEPQSPSEARRARGAACPWTR